MSRATRGTILVEQAKVKEQQAFAADQYIITLTAPGIAARAAPGMFAHIQCAPDIPMRRPISIMRAVPETGQIEFLYKIVGAGLRALSQREPGESISLIGPVGNPFTTNPDRPQCLLLGGGVGIPPMVFMAEMLANAGESWKPMLFMGSEVPFPFELGKPSVEFAGVPESATATMPFADSLGVPTRLASAAGINGAYQGFVTDLADQWLAAQDMASVDATQIFACGPEPMLEAAAALARRYSVPCQLCLEEFMACAVGGCAGCAVACYSDGEVQMKRVCVDGPVFPAEAIYP